jgi:RNA polymerase sigma-70 factor (ECF subfamily)
MAGSLFARCLTGWEWRDKPALRLEPRSPPVPTLDRRWFSAFIREHEAVLHATALRLCRNPTEARDLVQDTLERGWRNLDRYKPGTDGRAWLLTLLRHLFIDKCRSQVRERLADVSSEEVEERIAAPEPEVLPGWAAITPEQLREALGRIPEEFRLVYQLHALEGRSYIEISEQLGIPKATVGTRLIRARRRLKELLMPQSPGGDA